MKRFSKFIQESIELDEASKEHLERLKSMLDKAKPGSADHSQIRHAISAQYGDEHIPAKHRNVKPDMYEAVEVSHDRYMRSHGKKASGGHGTWMFTHKRMGDVNVDSDKEVHAARGKFSDAKKSAQQWAKRHGHSTVYVMEEVEQIDELKVPSKLQKAKFWLAYGKTPRQAVSTEKSYAATKSSDSLKRLKIGRTSDNVYKKGEIPKDDKSVKFGSPAHMQIKAIDRELKKRNEEVEQISERIYADDYKVGHEKSQFGGYRPHVTHKKTGKTMYLGQASYKTPEHAKGHANAYLKGYETAGDEHASRKGMEYQKANSKHLYVKEEAEQIDELKKSTLGSYIKKASARAVSDKTTADRLNRRAFDADNLGNTEKYIDASDRMQKKYKNRLAGIAKATDRLTKEEVEQIDEISTDLAHDVYKKRMAQAKAHVQQDNYSAARKAEKKAGETSLRMVKKILRREETELDNGYIESTNESVEMSMNQRKALEIGRKLQMMATKEKNDTIANAMANLGDHLESFGATFGPKNMSDLMKKTGLTKEAITMLIQRAQRQ